MFHRWHGPSHVKVVQSTLLFDALNPFDPPHILITLCLAVFVTGRQSVSKSVRFSSLYTGFLVSNLYKMCLKYIFVENKETCWQIWGRKRHTPWWLYILGTNFIVNIEIWPFSFNRLHIFQSTLHTLFNIDWNVYHKLQ